MLKKIMGLITMSVTIIILSFSLVFMVPQIFGIEPYTILSGSMTPKIPVGSIVFIDTNDKDVKVNEIIAFYDAGYTGKVVHRIKERAENGFITQGDANETIDLAVLTEDRIIGTYLFHIPKAGFVLEKKKPLLMLYVALLLFEYALPDSKKKPNENTTEENV